MPMSLTLRTCAIAWVCALLAGCAALTRPVAIIEGRPMRADIREFALDGRISVTRAAERAQAAIAWQHVRGASDEIDLYSPVGSQLARLTVSPAGARLETAEPRRYEGPDAEALSAQIFGSPLPLSGMPDWVLGRSIGRAVTEERDASGRYVYLAEAGWVIRYLEYESDSAAALPRTIDFERGDLHVRLRVDAWRELR